MLNEEGKQLIYALLSHIPREEVDMALDLGVHVRKQTAELLTRTINNHPGPIAPECMMIIIKGAREAADFAISALFKHVDAAVAENESAATH